MEVAEGCGSVAPLNCGRAQRNRVVNEQTTHGAEPALPRPPGVFRRWLNEHPRVVDGVIVACYVLGCAVMVFFEISLAAPVSREGTADIEGVDTGGGSVTPDSLATLFTWGWSALRLAIVAVGATALAYRRRFPLLGVIFVSLLMVFEQGLVLIANTVAVFFLLYAVPVYRGVRSAWIAAAFAVGFHVILLFLMSPQRASGLITPLGIFVADTMPEREQLVIAAVNSLFLLAVVLIAINIGNRRRYLEALIDRAHQLAREREQRAQLAVVTERSRIAREMHDIVAHSLSVMVTLTEAAHVTMESKPQAAKRAMEHAAETGRSALVEMRRALGLLHSDAVGDSAAPRTPQPGVVQLGELVEGFRHAGLQITITQSGVPAGDAAQQLAVYRIVQEGLTNALRYAGKGAQVQLTLEHTQTQSCIEIVDVPSKMGAVAGEDPELAFPAIPGGGRGLAGVRERVRMFGGSVDAGPHGSGWRLSAVVPTQSQLNGEQTVTLERGESKSSVTNTQEGADE